MSGFSIHPETRIGAIHLGVADLARSLSFYCDGLGLKLLSREDETAWLSAGGKSQLLGLTVLPNAKSKPARAAGLYHFAILVPTRYELARTMHHLLEIKYFIQGASDHSVSEAIYLSDPDGNGIEIYADRTNAEWHYERGQLQMGTEALNLDLLLAELGDGKILWNGFHPKTQIGHIHLYVSNLEIARKFYHEVLGFDLMMKYGEGALFLSAGGYHHHIGLNTWAGTNISLAPDDAVGLKYFTIILPRREELRKLVNRLKKYQQSFEQERDRIFLRDPFNNGIVLRLAE